MSPEILGLVSLASLFIFIFAGFPIAFTLLFLGLATGYLGIGKVVFNLMTLQIYGIMNEPVLAAVPFFLFMGYILESSGLMERLFKAFQMTLARLSGSLYVAVTATATIFAAATGIVGSSVTLLGVMAAPTMRQSNYNVRLSAGCITAGGTLGILIPPSIMLVVMGPVVGVPVTDLFAAAIFPGLLLAGLYMGYCLVRCKLNPSLGPPLSADQRADIHSMAAQGDRSRCHPGDPGDFGHPGKHPVRNRYTHRGGCLRGGGCAGAQHGLPAAEMEGSAECDVAHR